MIISGLSSIENKEELNKAKNIQSLELQNLGLDYNWSNLIYYVNLESLKIKDCYLDFKKFYNSLAELKKLKSLTFNHYCYFNKSKKDQLKINSKIVSLKIFKLEFPSPSDPDFEINNWSQKSYANKFNSLTDVPNSHLFFPNLEKIEFENYQTYRNRIIESGYTKDIKKLNSEIYWNMDLKSLSNFKSLNEIKIDDGKISDIVKSGILNHKNYKLKNLRIKFNGLEISDYPKIYNKVQTLSITSTYDFDKKEKTKVDKVDLGTYKDFENELCIKIAEQNLYNITYEWRKPWKFRKASEAIIDKNIETVIFDNTLDFCSRNVNNLSSQEQKIDFFLNFLKSKKNIKKIIFNFPTINYDDLSQGDIIFLKQFTYQLSSEFKDLKILISIKSLNEIITSKNNIFKIYLIYFINFLKNYNFIGKNVFFYGVGKEELEEFHDENIFKNIDSIVVIDDLFFNISKKTKNIDFVLSSQISESYKFLSHYPELNINYMGDPKKKYPFDRIYEELTRISTFNDANFKFDEDKLVIIAKKNQIYKLKNLKFKNFLSYLGNNRHLIGHELDDKKYKINKIYEINELNLKKLKKGYNLAVNEIINSGDFTINDNIEKDLNLTSDKIKVIDNLDYFGINRDQISSITHCWFEGVRPWMGKYVILKDLDKLFNTNNLEFLRLGDCIAFDNFQLPKIETLKYLKLDFSINEHRKKIDPSSKLEVNSFSNLPNIDTLDISGLYVTYPSELSRNEGINNFGTDRWGVINVNFNDIHKLNKLKKIKISEIKGSNLKSIKSLPAVENLKIKLFNITKDLNPDEEKYIENGVVDHDLKFLSGSKKLNKLDLVIGDLPCKEDMYGHFLSSFYKGNADFINYINYNLKELKLTINLSNDNQYSLQDFINNICNRFLKLEKLELKFGFAVDENSFSWEKNEYNKKLKLQVLDFKKFSKLKNLKFLSLWSYGSFINFKTINFSEIVKFKKIRSIGWHYETVDFEDFRKTRKIFKEENYNDPKYYQFDYDDYADDDKDYKNNWTRFNYIDTQTDEYDEDYKYLEDVYIEREKEENKKKYKKKN